MNTNHSASSRRRFRGSPLDKALGVSLALVSIVVPPLLYGQFGVIYALSFLSGLLLCTLREKMAAERAQAEAKLHDIPDALAGDGRLQWENWRGKSRPHRNQSNQHLISPGARHE